MVEYDQDWWRAEALRRAALRETPAVSEERPRYEVDIEADMAGVAGAMRRYREARFWELSHG